MTIDRLGMTVLSTHECLALLRSTEVGRLALNASEYPEVFPVNFLVEHGAVVFRTAEGTKLAGLAAGANVTFEADGYDAAAGEAWSVVVKGRAAEVAAAHDRVAALDLPLFPWQTSPKHHVVRIEPVEMSGRRFHAETRQEPERPAVRRAAQE